MPTLFHSSLGIRLSVHQVVQEIIRFMKEDEARRYKVVIGTDSELLRGGKADFVTAIVVHRVGNGGRYFWRRLELSQFHNLHDRIVREVLISLEAAQELLVETRQSKMPAFDFEIHIDVGENGATKSLIQEVVGIVRAHNFEPKTKPESFAATNVADRHV